MNYRRLTIAGLALFSTSVIVFSICFSLNPPRLSQLKIDRARAGDLPTLASTIEEYRKATGSYPSSLSDLLGVEGSERYVRYIPKDPWDSEYVYRNRGERYELYSIGSNGRDELSVGDDVVYGVEKKYSCANYGVNCPIKLSTILMAVSFVLAPIGLLVTIGGMIMQMIERARIAKAKELGAM